MQPWGVRQETKLAGWVDFGGPKMAIPPFHQALDHEGSKLDLRLLDDLAPKCVLWHGGSTNQPVV